MCSAKTFVLFRKVVLKNGILFVLFIHFQIQFELPFKFILFEFWKTVIYFFYSIVFYFQFFIHVCSILFFSKTGQGINFLYARNDVTKLCPDAFRHWSRDFFSESDKTHRGGAW